DEAIGRVDALDVNRAIDHWKANGLDLAPVLDGPAFAEHEPRRNGRAQDHDLDAHFDVHLIERSRDVIDAGGEIALTLPVRNTDRAVGTMLGHEVTKAHGEHGLPPSSITVDLAGSSGQSLGAFLPGGIKLCLTGDA